MPEEQIQPKVSKATGVRVYMPSRYYYCYYYYYYYYYYQVA